MNIEQKKEQLTKMSMDELRLCVNECRAKLAKMVALSADDIAECALIEAELKARLENGNI